LLYEPLIGDNVCDQNRVWVRRQVTENFMIRKLNVLSPVIIIGSVNCKYISEDFCFVLQPY